MSNISNLSTNVMDIYYNISNIVNPDIINNPQSLIGGVNNALNGWLTPSLLVVLGVVLYLGIKSYDESMKDSEAALYSSYVMSIMALFLFLISLGENAKLLSWEWLTIFLVLTGTLILVDKFNRSY